MVMDIEYVRDDIPALFSNVANKKSTRVKMKVCCNRRAVMKICSRSAQVFHFIVSMCYVWAGLVEFIRNPPFFDAYGDADTNIDLPKGFFRNDPRKTESGILRLMDIPILAMLIAYKIVCIWFRYKGLSWLATIGFTITFLVFWIVNFWASERFDWRNYARRMNGLQLQVSSIALSGTTVFMLIFFKRKRWPFKFKSSLSIKHNSAIHIIWNFFAIYLVMFSSLMIWFIKLYASWACFNSGEEISGLCSTTTEVQCYACSRCSHPALRNCIKRNTTDIFTCTSRFTKDKGAFCVFNYNMGIYGFLFTFAYIGGLSVFLSTFLRVIGHYIFRGFFLAHDYIAKFYHWSPGKRARELVTIGRQRQGTELSNSININGNNDKMTEDSVTYISESDGDDDDGDENILTFAAIG